MQQSQFINGGIGNDWCYFGCFANTETGLTAFQTQGEAFDLAATPPPVQGQTIRITGHGTDNSPSTWNQIQQTHAGPYISFKGSHLSYQVDTTGGSSGSPVINDDIGEAIGVHTHAGCNSGGGANNGTGSNTNVRYLQEHGVRIWDEWADEDGELGPVYGSQWRSWPTADGGTIDQISRVVEDIKRTPDSRRLIVSAWNVAEVDDMALPPCHTMFQFYVAPAADGVGELSCQLYQRSADIFLGVPFNIASYALLTLMIAQVTGLRPGDFVHTLGDAHLYANHLEQADEQLARLPMPLPKVHLADGVSDLSGFRYADFQLQDYRSHPAIKAPIAV